MHLEGRMVSNADYRVGKDTRYVLARYRPSWEKAVRFPISLLKSILDSRNMKSKEVEVLLSDF